MDEAWHYGTLGGVLSMAGWLISHAWRAGKSAGQITEQIDGFVEDVKDIKERLGRIEKLLMEGRR